MLLNDQPVRLVEDATIYSPNLGCNTFSLILSRLLMFSSPLHKLIISFVKLIKFYLFALIAFFRIVPAAGFVRSVFVSPFNCKSETNGSALSYSVCNAC